ncbi:MAG: hypothetical protein A2Z86_08160 [Candidatus Glassbacteria bacterium GWA2_58_10]|uniref:Uncharacterized protein n=1 Tax=Candidatus Glassbacteria bacterium GWA2_58_10 TaxID=1817865 RepID=A0A1F5YCD1_9BACT|nr:MAG: hypothetical protein A2Z86_08160 [Candidatus Glassbacteria bacterium GWA2_58_10]
MSTADNVNTFARAKITGSDAAPDNPGRAKHFFHVPVPAPAGLERWKEPKRLSKVDKCIKLAYPEEERKQAPARIIIRG